MAPSKISIPVDGSPASLRAVDFAIKMATQDPGSSLVLLLVLLNVQNISAMALAGAAMAGDLQEAASQASDETLNEAMGKLEAAGASCGAASSILAYGAANKPGRTSAARVSGCRIPLKIVGASAAPLLAVKRTKHGRMSPNDPKRTSQSVADLTEINECCRCSPHSTRSPRL
jgi:hypothetical protein